MSKGDAMKWYQPETDYYLKANRVDHGRNIRMPLQKSLLRVLASQIFLSCNISYAIFG